MQSNHVGEICGADEDPRVLDVPVIVAVIPVPVAVAVAGVL